VSFAVLAVLIALGMAESVRLFPATVATLQCLFDCRYHA
jgi:hypothetical protein